MEPKTAQQKLKEWREKNKEKIPCECGAWISRFGMKKHKETKIHKERLEKIKNI